RGAGGGGAPPRPPGKTRAGGAGGGARGGGWSAPAPPPPPPAGPSPATSQASSTGRLRTSRCTRWTAPSTCSVVVVAAPSTRASIVSSAERLAGLTTASPVPCQSEARRPSVDTPAVRRHAEADTLGSAPPPRMHWIAP